MVLFSSSTIFINVLVYLFTFFFPATGEFHHDEVKGGNLPASDKDGESSSVTPDSSAENCEGIIVGDD